MKQHRRDFIKKTSAAMLAGFSMSEISSYPLLPVNDRDDEAYWTLLREQFPLTKDMAYLNNGTLGPSPFPVIEAVKKGMMEADQFLNYSGWEHTIKKIAGFVGADEAEIALTHNTTEGINIGCWGLPLKKGDEVIMTTHEHAGNALPWLNRQQVHGIVIRTFWPASTAEETLKRISAFIGKKTKAIAVPHILCTQGQIFPVKEICELARAKGLFTVIDGAHGAGMLPLDLHQLDCDVYASCCHKWMLGSKGTGFLYVKKEFQETLQPYFVGAGSDNAKWDMTTQPTKIGAYAESAHRYFGGTQNAGLYKGVEAAIDFMEAIGMENIYKRVSMLGSYMQEELVKTDRVEVTTPSESKSRCGINGFRIKGTDSDLFYKKALEHKIRIRIVPENGLNTLRVSTHIYNNKQEIDRLVKLIGAI